MTNQIKENKVVNELMLSKYVFLIEYKSFK